MIGLFCPGTFPLLSLPMRPLIRGRGSVSALDPGGKPQSAPFPPNIFPLLTATSKKVKHAVVSCDFDSRKKVLSPFTHFDTRLYGVRCQWCQPRFLLFFTDEDKEVCAVLPASARKLRFVQSSSPPQFSAPFSFPPILRVFSWVRSVRRIRLFIYIHSP